MKWRVVKHYGRGVKEEEAWRVEPEKGMTQKEALFLMKVLDSMRLEGNRDEH
jgi:hypothetical protein